MTRCVSVPGVVPEPQDEGQASASGHDVASPCGPGLLHVHDEPRRGHGQPALPFPIPPASAVLLPPRHRSRFDSDRRPFLQPAALPRQFPDAVSSLPEAGAAVRLQTSITVHGADPRPRTWGNSLFLLGLSLQSVQRSVQQAPRHRLRLLSNQQN